jgi:F-type H+-transporting ATPase subunit a
MHEVPLIFPVNMIVAMGIPSFVAFSWVATIIIIGVALLVSRSMNMGRYFFPLVGTLFIYILVSNFLGLFPGCEAPTGNLNTTAALAIPVFLATHYYGIKIHKAGYLKHFVGPIRSLPALPLMILMFFIEIIGHLARPITLSVRLFGNMTAKHMLLLLAPWILPVPILILGVLVSGVQALVFTLLTALYLAGAVEEAH